MVGARAGGAACAPSSLRRWANLLNRALPLAKHFDGLRARAGRAHGRRPRARGRGRVRRVAQQTWGEPAPHRALEHTIELARAGNKYFDESARGSSREVRTWRASRR